MDICMLSSVHSADDIRIVEKEARCLAAVGHHVTVVARPPVPRDMRGIDFKLIDLPDVPRWKRPWIMGRAAMSLAQSLRPDVVQFHDPELIPYAFALRRHGCKIVYDVHEDLPADIYSKTWIPRLVQPVTATAVTWIEKLMAPRFDAIVAATPTIAERFRSYGAHVALVRNSVKLNEFIEPSASAPRKRQAVYVGMASFNRGLVEMVEACDAINLPLVIAGHIGSEEKRWIESHGKNVQVRGKLDRAEIGKLLSESTMGLCLLHPEPNHLYAMPTKLFEYMAAGLPVITSDLPAAKKIIEQAACGFSVPHHDSKALRDKLSILLSDSTAAMEMGLRGRETVSKTYNWEHDAAELVGLYNRLSSRRSVA